MNCGDQSTHFYHPTSHNLSTDNPALQMKIKVCVIGAGAAGLCAARYSKERGYDVTVYEQSNTKGGTWVYYEESNTYSSMYEVMKTNLPKEVMHYRDHPYPEHLPSFMNHQDVRAYLEEYGKNITVEFGHNVENVERQGEKWEVIVSCGNKISIQLFDAVFVCSGHNSRPYNPFEGQKFDGNLMHSHHYKSPAPYAGKTLVCAGAGASGIDIALQCAATAEKVYLCGRADYVGLPSNVVHVKQSVVRVEGDSVYLKDGQAIKCDDVIVCTGYLYNVSYLKSVTQSAHYDTRVEPVYEHVLHMDHPTSLFFIGLNFTAVNFMLYEIQVNYALQVLSGKVPTPTRDEMELWHKQKLESLKSNGIDEKMYHRLQDDQWDYYDRMTAKGDLPPFYDHLVREIHDFVLEERKKNVTTYKNINFVIENDTFRVAQ